MVSSIRLPNLLTLEIDVSIFSNDPDCFTNVKVIDCPNLMELLYRPFLYEKLGDKHTWNLPNLKKLKLYCSQTFIKSLKNLEVLLILRFEKGDEDLLRELPKLKFLDVQEIDSELFGWIEKEHGQRVRANYRGLPAQLARSRIQAPSMPNYIAFSERLSCKEGNFREEDLEIYRGLFERANDEIHFYYCFYILDSSKQIERSFFRKFVDVFCLNVCGDNLGKDELLGILASFNHVELMCFSKPNFELDFYKTLVPAACPHLKQILFVKNENQMGEQFEHLFFK